MKKAFTLIELVIAIGIFSVLVLYMYKAVATTQNSTNRYEKMYQKSKKITKFKNIIYNDIFNQVDPYKDTNITTKDNLSTYYLRTKNSLNALTSPYVAYRVINENLFRFESNFPFTLPLTYENRHLIKIDKLLSHVSKFTIYSHKNSKLIDIFQNNTQTVFEISLPYSRKVVIVGG